MSGDDQSFTSRRQRAEAELKALGKISREQRARLEACNAQIGSRDAELARLEESRTALHQLAAAKNLVRP